MLPTIGFCLAFLCAAPSALAFCPEIHSTLIHGAFGYARGIGTFADRGAAITESMKIDEPFGPGSGEEHQFKHSMRPAGTSLVGAQGATALYVDYYLNLAVIAAKENPPQRKLAGGYLGRILHAVQDRKHRWTSCWADSNLDVPPNSSMPCSDTPVGCPNDGEGNHGLLVDCTLPRDFMHMIRNAPLSFNALCMHYGAVSNNFQLRTDADPQDNQLERAEDEGRDLLVRFLMLVR